MKPYRASHQSTIKAGWYENIVYGPLSYDSYLWEEEKKIQTRTILISRAARGA